MGMEVRGEVGEEVWGKDLILGMIGKIGRGGGEGDIME